QHGGLADRATLDMLEQGGFSRPGLAGDEQAGTAFFDPFQNFLETVVPFEGICRGGGIVHRIRRGGRLRRRPRTAGVQPRARTCGSGEDEGTALGLRRDRGLVVPSSSMRSRSIKGSGETI